MKTPDNQGRDRPVITEEMIEAGRKELALSFDPCAMICELSAEDLVATYKAMRRLEPVRVERVA